LAVVQFERLHDVDSSTQMQRVKFHT
jgi:hypothetical protein